MIEVRLAAEENPGIGPLEAKGFHAGADLCRGGLKIGVDEDVALRRSDQVAGEIARADVVEIVRNLERRKRGGPVRVLVCPGEGGEKEQTECQGKAHSLIL